MQGATAAAQVRIARPTNKLKLVTEFYTQALGLPIIGSFSDHEGYDGVMLGIKDVNIHLEFTSHVDGSPCPAPTLDNLLVFYFATQSEYDNAIARIESFGNHAVEPENSYWEEKSKTYEDPDGWRIVLFNGLYTS